MEDLKFKDVIYIVKNALTHSECDDLVDEYNRRSDTAEHEHCNHALSGELTQSTFTMVPLIPDTETFDCIHNNTHEMIQNWVEYLDSFNAFHTHALKQALKYSHMYRLMRYDVGGWIHPHIDWDHFVHASCTFTLSDEYEGGEFVFFNGNHVVRMEKGDGMIWPADPFWVHEVRPITKGVRYSTNSFICSLPNQTRAEASNSIWTMGEDDSIKDDTYYDTSTQPINRLIK
jgi:hypothetical protein